MDNINKTKSINVVKMVAILIAVLFIPAMYSSFYLASIWDPYGNLDKLPVAIVNEDLGGFGDALVDEMAASNSLNFDVVTREEAEQGLLNDNKYYSAIYIPADFSESFLSATTATPKQAVITYTNNQKRNYVGNVILTSAMKSIENMLYKNYASTFTYLLLNSDPRSLQNVDAAALSEYVANAIVFEAEPVNEVENYGTGMAPYFLSLSIMIGAVTMVIAVYYDPERKVRKLSPQTDNDKVRFFGFLGLGGGQGLLAGLFAQFCIGGGMQINNVAEYYMSLVLIGITFSAIVQFFMVYLRDIGKLLSILLLVLQLVACGGVFPVELQHPFFQGIGHALPMTYGINMLREAISGDKGLGLISNGLWLCIFLAGAVIAGLGVSIVTDIVRKRKTDAKDAVSDAEAALIKEAVDRYAWQEAYRKNRD